MIVPVVRWIIKIMLSSPRCSLEVFLQLLQPGAVCELWVHVWQRDITFKISERRSYFRWHQHINKRHAIYKQKERNLKNKNWRTTGWQSERPFTSHRSPSSAKCALNRYFITSFIYNSIALSINYCDVRRAAEWGGSSLYCKDRYRLQRQKNGISMQMKRKIRSLQFTFQKVPHNWLGGGAGEK